MTPIRIQRSRKRGATHPEGTLFVDRTSKVFGNPYKVVKVSVGYRIMFGSEIWKDVETKEQAVSIAILWYKQSLLKLKSQSPEQYNAMMERIRAAPFIACYCAVDSFCHGDVLIELATA